MSKLYTDGSEVVHPTRGDRPVPHNVKFRHAEEGSKVCDSQLCPYPGNLIEHGDKYARVQRIGPNRKSLTEFFHPKCYDNEFEQGDGAELAS